MTPGELLRPTEMPVLVAERVQESVRALVPERELALALVRASSQVWTMTRWTSDPLSD